MNLYSPPNKGYPQELPDRWRFDDGTVRTDLKLLSNQQLAALDWIGPIEIPKGTIFDENGEIIETGSYNPKTHKAIWYAAKRKFAIVENHIDEIPYLSGELVPEDILKLPNWNTFESIILQSPELKNFITFAASKNPLIASTFPASFFEAKHESYNSFKIVWEELVKISPVNVNVIESIIAVAKSCNLPQEFIQIIEDTVSHIIDGTLETAKYPDWDTFESIVLQSNEMKNFIAYASTQNPLITGTFPAAFFEVKNNRYNSFKIVWNELVKITTVDKVVLDSIINVAKSCDLPQEFIDILE
jgi:hypothetical protein